MESGIARDAVTPVRVFEDADGLGRALAEEFAALAQAAIAARGRFMVALSGGSTPKRLYRLLSGPPFRERVAWGAVEFFWGDERAVPPDHPDSNYGSVRDGLLAPLGVRPERVHRIRAEMSDRDAAARAYEAEISTVFGVGVNGLPPAFDLILLGMGADGHTASLFPGSAGLVERKRWVVSHFVPSLGAERITLTVPILNRAREIRIMVAGREKAGTLSAALAGDHDPATLPIQLIKPERGRLVWFVDQEAASTLGQEEAKA